MRASYLVSVALALGASGCAIALPILGEGRRYKDDDDPPESPADDKPRSTFDRCLIGYWLAGMAIDGLLIAADLGLGEETNALDGLIVVPLGLDMLVGTVLAIDCIAAD